MTIAEELQDIRSKAENLRDKLIGLGLKATVLYKLEQVIRICRDGTRQEDVVEAKQIMWNLESDGEDSRVLN
jgi:hypothetical protein